jgi:hypothetical protein
MDLNRGVHLNFFVEKYEDEEILWCCWTDPDGSWWRVDIIDGQAYTYCEMR